MFTRQPIKDLPRTCPSSQLIVMGLVRAPQVSPPDAGDFLMLCGPETLAALQNNIDRFRADNDSLIRRAQYVTGKNDSQVMHDLWLTQNRHGAGFWDGDWGRHGDALTVAAHAIGECSLYVDGENRLYLA